jgi:hypothetical protein
MDRQFAQPVRGGRCERRLDGERQLQAVFLSANFLGAKYATMEIVTMRFVAYRLLRI